MQVGSAIVLAVTTAIIASGATVSSSPEAVLEAYRPGLAFAAAVSAVSAISAVVAVLGLVLARERSVDDEAEPTPELVGAGG